MEERARQFPIELLAEYKVSPTVEYDFLAKIWKSSEKCSLKIFIWNDFFANTNLNEFSTLLNGRVWNISKVKIDSYAFPTTDDHSKWAVGDKDSAWICVGDINRAVSVTALIRLK